MIRFSTACTAFHVDCIFEVVSIDRSRNAQPLSLPNGGAKAIVEKQKQQLFIRKSVGLMTFANIRIGLGIDSHRIEQGGSLVLGGISIDAGMHFVGHSDADVLLHAITDSVLSASGLPDIGQMFPNTLEENRGRDSADMLRRAYAEVTKTGWHIINLDCVVELERPKLSPYKASIAARIASILGINPEQVAVKAKTGEGVGEIGSGQLGRATCVALLTR